MKLPKQTIAAAIFSAACALPATAGTSEDLDEIIAMTVTEEVFEAAIYAQRPVISAAIKQQFREKGLQVSDTEGFLDLLMEEFMDSFLADMQSGMKKVYADSFSTEEIEGIAEFYRTAAGKALAEKTPEMLLATSKLGTMAGQRAGLQAMPAVMARLKSEGIVIDSPSVTDKLLEAFQ